MWRRNRATLESCSWNKSSTTCESSSWDLTRVDQVEMTPATTADARGGRPTLGNLLKVEIIDADGLRSIDWMGMSELYWMVQVAGRGRPSSRGEGLSCTRIGRTPSGIRRGRLYASSGMGREAHHDDVKVNACFCYEVLKQLEVQPT